MVNIGTISALQRAGFPMSEICAAVQEAEENGSASIGGYVIRFRQDTGEMILLHPSWNGIYTGDYSAHLIFQKDLSYFCGHFYARAKHRDLPGVLAKLDQCKTNGYILCECDAASFPRRKKQVEKLGYTVCKSNITFCESASSSCVFLIS